MPDTTLSEDSQGELKHRMHQQELLGAVDQSALQDASPMQIVQVAIEQIAHAIPARRISVRLETANWEAGAFAVPSAGSDGLRTIEVSSPARLDEIGDQLNLSLVADGIPFGHLHVELLPGAALDGDRQLFLDNAVHHLATALAAALRQATLRQRIVELEHRIVLNDEELAHQQGAMDGLRTILRFLAANRPLQEILDYILRQAELNLGVDGVAVFQPVSTNMQPMANSENLLHWRGRNQVLSQEYCLAAVEPLVGEVAHTLKPAIGKVGQRAVSAPAMTMMVVPMLADSRLSGVVAFYFPESSLVSSDVVESATALGEQAWLAIESARLHLRAQQAAILEERERLTRELHDAVIQSIYSLTLFAEAGRRLASMGQLERVQEYLIMLGETANQALKQMRLMLYELRPAVLEQVGLIGALRQRLDAVERQAGINARLDAPDSLRLPTPVEDGLYRISQEALNNALKHSSASAVVVSLTQQSGAVTLRVYDDGVGFEPSEVEGPGLTHMFERAAGLNADLDIEAAPGQGTSVTVTWPRQP